MANNKTRGLEKLAISLIFAKKCFSFMEYLKSESKSAQIYKLQSLISEKKNEKISTSFLKYW